MSKQPSDSFLPKTGNYQELLSYKKTEIIYDLTFRFCERFLNVRDRTTDQMVQAARSGKQNIAEGSKAAKTSSEMEIKLTNVARASLEELLLDYQDYLRTRKHEIWSKDSEQAQYIRKLGRSKEESYATYNDFIETRDAGVVANMALCLIHQANYLLDKQIAHLEKFFLEKGGLKENMYQARIRYRRENPSKD